MDEAIILLLFATHYVQHDNRIQVFAAIGSKSTRKKLMPLLSTSQAMQLCQYFVTSNDMSRGSSPTLGARLPEAGTAAAWGAFHSDRDWAS